MSDEQMSDEQMSDEQMSDEQRGPEETSHEHGGTDRAPVGVAPWPGGRASWPTDPRYDPELLEHGDARNVLDGYRYWRLDAIVAELDVRRAARDGGFSVAIENWQHDMNIGSIVRSANAFLAETVHIIGRRRWNKRGAMVTDRYQHVVHHATIEAFVESARDEGRPIIAVDNVPGSVEVSAFAFPERCILLFGQEGPGLTSEALAAADAVVEIRQFGSTRSINAGAAAAIVMHEWIRTRAPQD